MRKRTNKRKQSKEVKFVLNKGYSKKFPNIQITINDTAEYLVKSGMDAWIKRQREARAKEFIFEDFRERNQDRYTNVKTIKLRDNCYMSISGHISETTGNECSPTISFEYVGGDVLVEWEVKNGPITVITKCLESLKNDTDFGRSVRPHHIFGWCTGYGNWTQCAVRERGLDKAFIEGNYDKIFEVLKYYYDMHVDGGTISVVQGFINLLEGE